MRKDSTIPHNPVLIKIQIPGLLEEKVPLEHKLPSLETEKISYLLSNSLVTK
jgi:hypothetical protein